MVGGTMHIDDVIRDLVPGQSFIDVGGLWGTVNERVSVAVLAGGRDVTMFDHAPPGDPIWGQFHQRCADLGVSAYHSVRGDLDDPADVGALGRFDVVHCSGILYHTPNPMATLERLAGLAGRHLLLGTCTVPEHIENAAGSLDFSGGQVVFIPAVSGAAQAILAAHFTQHGLDLLGINHAQPPDWGQAGHWNYQPWWWLWSAETVARMVSLFGFRVRDRFEAWPGLAHYLICERD